MEDKLFDTIKHVKAEDAVKTCMMEYQRYLADTKLPHPVDGLKDVVRRAIYVMGTSRDFTKFAQFIAATMEIHPHGDSSIKSAVERLFRTWDVRNPLILCEGNVGSYTGTPGAPRYLDVSSTEFARDLFFNGVHQATIPMKYTIEFKSFEPEYFIPRLPNALLMGNLTIGLGFKSVVFPLNLENVCILVQKYIEHKSKDPFTPFGGKGNEQYFLPDFPTHCYLRNEKELMESYKNEDFSCKVFTDGDLEITKHTITLLNIPALLPFVHVQEKLVEMIKQKSHWINSVLKDFKNTISQGDHGSLKFIFKNNVDTWKVLPKLKQMVNFTAAMTPIYSYEIGSRIATLDPPRVLNYWYNARHESIVNGLNADQNALMKEELIIKALILIVDHKDKVINIIKNADTREDAIHKLSEKFDITLNQAQAITRSSIDRLVKASKDELYKQKEDIENRLNDINSKFTKVADIIYNDTVYFRKKYKTKRRTIIPNFIGYVKIGERGLYQYSTENEMFSILNEFSGIPMSIHQYKYPNKKRMILNNNKLEEFTTFSIPKHTTGKAILECAIPETKLYTVAHIGETVSCVKGYNVPKDENIQVEYVTRNFYGIFKNGHIENTSVDTLSSRKRISSGAKSDLIYAIPYGMDLETSVVIYMSTSPSYINTLLLTKVFSNKKNRLNKLMTTPPHDFIVLDTIDIENDGVIVNIPKSCVNIAIDYVYISSNINDLISRKTPYTAINLRSGSFKLDNGTIIRPSRHSDCSNMVVI